MALTTGNQLCPLLRQAVQKALSPISWRISRDVKRGIAGYFGDRGHSFTDHRASEVHGFEQRHSKAFVSRSKNHRLGIPIQAGKLILAYKAEIDNFSRRDAAFGAETLYLFPVMMPGQHQLQVGACVKNFCKCADQEFMALVRPVVCGIYDKRLSYPFRHHRHRCKVSGKGNHMHLLFTHPDMVD